MLGRELRGIFDGNDIDVVLEGDDDRYGGSYEVRSDGEGDDELLEQKEDEGGFNEDNFDEGFEKDGVFRGYYKCENVWQNIGDK